MNISRRLSKHMLVPMLVSALLMNDYAQTQAEQTDPPINAAMRMAVVEAVLKRLNESYVSPEVAAQMERAIRARMQRPEYDQVTTSSALAQALTSHLREVSNDRHLGIRFSDDPIPANGDREPTPEERERFRRLAASVNFGFEEVKRLNGNVGYIELDGFINPELGADTAIAAMQFLANTDALIIDFTL